MTVIGIQKPLKFINHINKMYFVKTPYLVKKLYSRNRIWDFEDVDKIIYLTFDDGPVKEVTPWVIDILDKFNAKATFFCVGDNVRKNPLLLEKIISKGHNIGNHTFNHLNGWKTETKEYVDNVLKCNEYFKTNLFRPPYGKIRPTQVTELQKYFKIICWSVLTGDFDKEISKEKCLDGILKNACEGSIICFHDSIKAKENLFYALPAVLTHFSSLGYKFLSIPYNVKPLINLNQEERSIKSMNFEIIEK